MIIIGIREIKICAHRMVLSSTIAISRICSMLKRLISLFTTTVYKKEARG